MTLDAIFFDIDDTLFSTSVFAEKARRAAIDAMIAAGLRADRETCLRELREVIAEFSSNYGHHFERLLQRLPDDAVEGLNRSVLTAAGVVAYHETKWREFQVYDDVYDVLRWLSDRDLLCGVISAGLGIKQAEKLIRLRLVEFLTPSAIFFTEDVGINKPNPKLYRDALARLGLAPERTMYVGDNPLHDIDPANDCGIITVRSRRSGKYADVQGVTEPNWEIRDFYELRMLLETEFGIAG